MKVPAATGLLIVGGAALLYGTCLLLVRQEVISPERLHLVPPLVVVWIGVCLVTAMIAMRRREK